MKSGRARLREWLDRSHLNQTQGAALLDVHPVYLGQLLKGDRTPGLANAIKIAQVTGIAVESWMLTDVSEPLATVPAKDRKRQR